jgi:hypothetical protein
MGAELQMTFPAAVTSQRRRSVQSIAGRYLTFAPVKEFISLQRNRNEESSRMKDPSYIACRWKEVQRLPFLRSKTRFRDKCVSMLMRFWSLLLALFLAGSLALGQESTGKTPDPLPTATVPATLTPDQIRELIRQTADNDMQNDKKQRDYTYVERDEEKRLDGKGRVKSTETKTYDVMEIYGEQVQRLIAKDDKRLSEKDAKKEDDKIQRLIEKRRNESPEDSKKRLEKEEKEREHDRKFVQEVADAYNFKFDGIESIDGRKNYVIEGDPKPGYQPHLKEAKVLPKLRFRAWIDKGEKEWTKLDIQFIDTASWGLFMLRIHKGTRVVIEQMRVNDEIWLPQHVTVNADFRLALLKNFDIALDDTFRDYKRFRTDVKIIPLGEVQQSP